MSIIVVGLSHKTAPVDVREKLSFPEATVPEALKALKGYEGIRESLILSTCNRVELYASVQDSGSGVAQVKKFISDYHKLSPESLEQSLYVQTDAEAVRHTFRVASSLDSMVVGEPQILGQLKDAFEIALKAKTTSAILNKLLKKAISAAKRVRTETKIAESAVSISFAAVELARKIFGELDGKTVMLLGAGEMAELAARHLLNNGVKSIMVANRTFERAVELAKEFNGSAVHFDDFPTEMVMADILICSTGAPHYVVKHDVVGRALKDRRHKPIFMIDISVPRNIDPEVNKIDNVYLYDIDDLKGVVSSNIEGRQKEAEKAEEIVVQEVETFLQWERSLDAVPTIVDLREKVEDIRKCELEKALGQLNGISDEQRNTVEALSTAIVNKIVHAPIVVLKREAADTANEELFKFARKLFNLDKELKRHIHDKGFGSSGKDGPGRG
ncbi:MAG: glutamyl-tRNA reductase [Nitrospirae bacterium RBG_19FT_COMBO_55_12]|nr:MAG: glutamyl-tRNA reductase [Nitrospirae bacterium RBG_19FT_COMBO_55_12]